MSDLVEFLRARLAEDEAWAHNPECDQDPARVLREVERDRRILDEHFGFLHPSGNPDRACRRCSDRRTDDDPLVHDDRWLRLEPAPCPTLRLLALPYADHLDYRQEWEA